MMNGYLAIDIGGTFIKSGIVNEAASISKLNKTKTPETLEGLLDAIDRLRETHCEVRGVAVSCPGAVSESGEINGTSALPYLHGPNIKQQIEDRTGLPVFMENDANCVGYAEIWKGKAQGNKDALILVIGTGVGGALIKNGTVHKGANLHGGEFGYMLIPADSPSGYKTLSDTGATGALINQVALRKQYSTVELTGEAIFINAEKGDKVCQQAISDFYRSLALGIYNLQYMYDPEVILIGGGISARDDLIANINSKLEDILSGLPGSTVKPNVETCEFRQHANLLGAVFGYMRNISPVSN
ncbi:ROK family protein [Lentibacillus salicampi]|uniref:ROK family protein n=1 Tax=Lentibacillus salicampi TaxID=175306 RepID=A0A4Y9ABB4_9BACI|nr:ROK family protein [Lentibacillus salicampi]TFJ93208.1 ROK family protein [Lentibacillus salicampi]